ncbi:MAG: tRNA (N6-threonylcarbamoyladenosine(37)-N6)-methyltransferase TrmO [Bacteroidales bacterium]|nr:tRNA (N6-threonylcarbamoyladenosine(37)-N6)-methyltransferase TrmO [Bacteroidales bacterium]
MMEPIAHIENDYDDKFGIPRQSGLVTELSSIIVFEPTYRIPEALREIETFDYIWLIWQFNQNLRDEWSPTVRPPRLGGNQRVGVFASRSPFRPNGLGLSSVRLLGVERKEDRGDVLWVAGADLMNGTPIFDIKPYIPYTDSHPEARAGFAPERPKQKLHVNCPPTLLSVLPDDERRHNLLQILSLDPRPPYQDDLEKMYGFVFAKHEIRFRVVGETLQVMGVEKA